MGSTYRVLLLSVIFTNAIAVNGQTSGTPSGNPNVPLERMPRELETTFASSALPKHLRNEATVHVLDPAQAALLEVRAFQLNTELRRGQLHALKAQLEPHFLFNTLNAIMVLVRGENEDQAVEMLQRLRELWSRAFRDADAHEVAYMCLQPIVENAIRHGVSRSSAAGTISDGSARDRIRVLVSRRFMATRRRSRWSICRKGARSRRSFCPIGAGGCEGLPTTPAQRS